MNSYGKSTPATNNEKDTAYIYTRSHNPRSCRTIWSPEAKASHKEAHGHQREGGKQKVASSERINWEEVWMRGIR